MSIQLNENQLLTLADEIISKNDSDRQRRDPSIIESIELLESLVEGSKDIIVRGYNKIWVINEKGEVSNEA